MTKLDHSLSGKNPFVEIHPAFYLLLVLGIFYLRILNPLVEFVFFDERPLVALRCCTFLLESILLFGPILFYQRGRMGWLHPFVLPATISLLMTAAKQSGALFEPLAFRQVLNFNQVGLQHLNQMQMAWVLIKIDLINITVIATYYLSFFLLRWLKTPRVLLRDPPNKALRFLALGLIGFGAAIVIIKMNGGIQNTILALAGGRYRFRESLGGGHFVTMTNFLRYAWLLWFVFQPRARFNPLFWLYVLASLAVTFTVTGSRSGVVLPLIFLGLIYIYHTQKIPMGFVAAGGVFVIAAVGVLGIIRSQGQGGTTELDLSVVLETSLSEKIAYTTEEISGRVSGTTMVAGKAMDVTGPLWGRTYLSAIFFWVPRAIWKHKPRGAGAYAGNILYYEKSLAQNPHGGDALGIPVTPSLEAYWNFWYIGVLLLGVVKGLIHRFFHNFYLRNPYSPVVVLLYIFMIGMTNMAMRSIVSFFQGAVIITIILILGNFWRPFKMRLT